MNATIALENQTQYITGENSVFAKTPGGFISLKTDIRFPEEEKAKEEKEKEIAAEKEKEKAAKAASGETVDDAAKEEEEKKEKEQKEEEEKKSAERKTGEYTRVMLIRTFPFLSPNEFICVNDGENKEIGIIKDFSTFSEEQSALLKAELDRRYFAPHIIKIESVKEKFGFSYWAVETTLGHSVFNVRDPHRAIVKVEGRRYFVTDVDGNRYEIPDVDKLDSKSLRAIEMYV